MNPARSPLALIAALPVGVAMLTTSPAMAAVDAGAAADVFAQARAICDRDAGTLWGRSLCGPMMLVDPADRSLVANQGDAEHALTPLGSVFTGVLPDAVVVANTPTEWSGTRWTQIMWPLPDDAARRHVLIAHELFHRIQPGLGLTRPEAGNQHLDSLEGRYLLQLEWRAVAKAVAAPTARLRQATVADALLFRQQRYRLFADAASQEAALEVNEGVPEYTGVKLGLPSPQERIRYAVYDLSAFVRAPSFVRSFAYATGPAYGLLLDRADPAWRSKLNSGRRLDQLLSAAYRLPAPIPGDLKARAAAYDDGALRGSETARDEQRRVQLAAIRARLVEGPVLVLPLRHVSYQFNPQTLQPLGQYGTVYPTVRLSGDFGILEVESGGALLSGDMKTARVTLTGLDRRSLKGDGWRLVLEKGWTVAPGARNGDLTVTPSAEALH